MKISLIISFYKNFDNLDLILQGLSRQSSHAFEAIIAEDDCNPKTLDFIAAWREKSNFQLLHVFQEKDNGFRKNQILNTAIQSSNHDILVFIDGDCIPHKHFIKSYLENAAKGKIFYGRRVNLGLRISKELLAKNSLKTLNLKNILFSDSSRKKEAIYSPYFSLKSVNTGLLGCNWGVCKEHLLEVNGFDEDYVSPGVGEDVDIEWRLISIGLQKSSMKNKGIVYHIYHPRSYSEDGVSANYKLMEKKIQEKNICCLNGLDKL